MLRRLVLLGRPYGRNNNPLRRRSTVAGKSHKEVEKVTLKELQRQLKELHKLVEGNQKEISKNQASLREVSSHAVARMKDEVNRIGNLSIGSHRKVSSLFNRWTGSVSLLLGGFGVYWFKREKDNIYDSMGHEASLVIDKVIKDEELHHNAIALIEGLTTDPKTLAALVVLVNKLLVDPSTLQSLIELLTWLFKDERTVNNLVYLLQQVFSDPSLQKKTGEFLLESLDTPSTKQMLHDQTVTWVNKVVLDEQVHRNTALGIQSSVKHAANPVNWFGGKKKEVKPIDKEVQQKAADKEVQQDRLPDLEVQQKAADKESHDKGHIKRH